jgi:two-component system response regulator HydG
MTELRRRIECIAASAAPVLISGESGSGKDLVAQAVHDEGPRRNRPFVSVNAAALPEALLESELFGHVRGAFTGATEARTGLFATAHGGTLFLDEIGDMPRGLQAKLLRVLEIGEVRPIGSDHVRTVDVRVIAATHRDLSVYIASGQFREDLYFRLNVLPIAVPPLRERRSDIAELAAHFLAKARERMPGSPVRSFGPEALDALERAPWPGNVRELASTVERTVVFGRHATVGLEDLPRFTTGPSSDSGTPPARELCTLRRLSEEHVAWVLQQTEGNKPRAAKILGINLSTLYRWQRPTGRSD